MKKLVIITVVAMMMAACGGKGKIPDGTYVGKVDNGRTESSFTFSGKNIKVVLNGRVVQENTYTLEEGTIIMGGYLGKVKYELDGDKLMIDGNVHIKQSASPQSGSRGGGNVKIPDGKYVNESGLSFTFSGKKLTISRNNFVEEGTYEVKDGVLIATNKNGKITRNEYILEGNKLKINFGVSGDVQYVEFTKE